MKNPILVFVLAFLLIATGLALVLKGIPADGSEVIDFQMREIQKAPDAI